MKIEGFDRLIIGVRNMDKAKQFFANKLGIEFTELTGPVVDALGERACITFDKQLELISPIDPLPESAPPFISDLAKVLEDKETVLLGLVFRVKNTAEFTAEAEREGVCIEDILETDEFNEILSVRGIREILTNKADTLGMTMAFTEYERI